MSQETPSASGSSLSGRAWFQQFAGRARHPALSEFRPGDQVRVWYRIQERNRTRLAPFEGVVIRRRGAGMSASFTVRRVTYGEGVERIFPVHAPALDRIEILRRGRVRRARLYYLRTKIGRTKIGLAAQPATNAESAPEPSSNVQRSEPSPSSGT